MSTSAILDKNVFLGEDIIHLDNLARHHTVIIPAALAIECATSDKPNSRYFMTRINDLILNGAWIALEEPKIIHKEVHELTPCHDIIDHILTEYLRRDGLPKECDVPQEEIKKQIWNRIGWQRPPVIIEIRISNGILPWW